MPGDLNITNTLPESIDEYPAKAMKTLAIRINFLKKKIEKTLILNHDCSDEELAFLLKRL